MLEQPMFGQHLKALRLARGLSQSALADSELSTGYISRLESGLRPPTSRVVAHLAQVLDVPTSAFEQTETSSLAQLLAATTSAPSPEGLVEALTEALRTGGEDLDPVQRWQALWQLAQLCGDQGRHDEEHKWLLELNQLGDRLDVPEFRARALTRLAESSRVLGDSRTAWQYAVDAHGYVADLSVADHSAVLHALIAAEAETGRLTEARAHADELCELTRNTPESLLVKALWAAATVRIRQGDHTSAQDILDRALDKLNSRDDLSLWMRLRLAAASLYLQISPTDTSRARLRLEEVRPAVDLIGTDLHQQQILSLWAQLAFEEGRIDDARELCDRLDEQDLRLSFRDGIRLQVLRGRLLMLSGRTDEGVHALQELAQQAQSTLNVDLAAEIWRILAETLTRVRQIDDRP
ncbi:helix-turn-helix domain-containing protein [Nocardia suismassiliense]|uniref:Helix-turn-helix domain-containing protein n=1 Tax=Nocardia suismassiliense TaxID=2077092 RepID=A0ABW6QME4_9NOCA